MTAGARMDVQPRMFVSAKTQALTRIGSQVRTYTLQPYTMVKDERTDHKATNAEAVLDGDLDDFIETYLLASAEKRQAKKSKQAGADG